MNLRIKNKNLCFKITEEELNTLIDHKCLNIKICFPDKELIIMINPQGREPSMEAKLTHDQNETYLNLLVPPEKIIELSDIGRNKKGIETTIDDLSISLQVDIRADSRKTAQQ